MICAVVTSYAGQPTDESARTVVERRFAAVKRHDLDAIAALYAPEAVEISPGFCADRSGPEGARRTHSELFQAYPAITADAKRTTLFVRFPRRPRHVVQRSENLNRVELPLPLSSWSPSPDAGILHHRRRQQPT